MGKGTTIVEEAAGEAGDPSDGDAIDAEVLEEEIARHDEAELGQMENAALAVREHVTVEPATMPSPREWDAMRAMATEVCKTEFVPSDFRNRPEACLAAILTGRELGIGPMQALKEVSIIDGRPALSAQLMLALLRKGGVMILESQSTNDRAWIKAQRTDTGEVCEVEWTMEQAVTAGLAGKANFRKYPADMLWARAVGRLGRRIGSDLLAGMAYTAEEVRDFSDDGDAETYHFDPVVVGQVEPHRVEGPGETPVPRSWGEMNERLQKAYGEAAAQDFWQFARQLTRELYGKSERKELTSDEAQVVGQKLATAVLKLLEIAPSEFPPPSREQMQEAFASVLESGVVLVGPPWSMSPSDVEAGYQPRGAEENTTKEEGEDA